MFKHVVYIVGYFQQIIEDDSINLDWMFRISMVSDLVSVCSYRILLFCDLAHLFYLTSILPLLGYSII